MNLPFLQYFSKYYDSYKTYKMGPREMQLREDNALTQDQNSSPSAHVIQFRTAYESSSSDSTHSSGLHGHPHSNRQKPTCRHTHIYILEK